MLNVTLYRESRMPDEIITLKEVLRSLNFGQRIAEEERDLLATYFVETDQWRRMYGGHVDVVYGAKGSGKSALYFLLLDKSDELRGSGVHLITAEKPRGSTVLLDFATEPPAAEQEFVNLWKLYVLSLVGRHLNGAGASDADGIRLIEKLREAGLLEGPGGLKGLLRTVRDYVSQFSGIQGALAFDPSTSSPSLTGRVLFENPSQSERSAGALSVDELFEAAEASLARVPTTIWILLDRLDVAFAETPDLEQNALRALFKAYLDLQDLPHIKLKIFLRTDIWRRLTRSGFREASHITRTVTIKWDRSSLLNLIVRRSLQNKELNRFYDLDEGSVASTEDQEALFYGMFPEQVDSGPNKPATLDWLLSRTQDGTRQPAPRELIHLLNSIRDIQYRKLELGEQEPPARQLFARVSLKEALPEVSRVRLEQTLYAEYPGFRDYCEKLRSAKTQQSPETLSTLWATDPDTAVALARQLVEVGFFEERGSRDRPEFWVPFLYRDALEMVQGTATE